MKRNLGLVMVFAFLLLAACSLALSQGERGLTRDVTPTNTATATITPTLTVNAGATELAATRAVLGTSCPNPFSLPTGAPPTVARNMNTPTPGPTPTLELITGTPTTKEAGAGTWWVQPYEDVICDYSKAITPTFHADEGDGYYNSKWWAVCTAGGMWLKPNFSSIANGYTPQSSIRLGSTVLNSTGTCYNPPLCRCSALSVSTNSCYWFPAGRTNVFAESGALDLCGSTPTYDLALDMTLSGDCPSMPYVPMTPAVDDRPQVWFTEGYRQPVATPCVDYNGRGGCGQDDAYWEVGVAQDAQLGCYQVGVYGANGQLQCQYSYPTDNLTWPLKTTWQDLTLNAAATPCPSWGITGTLALYDPAGNLLDSLGMGTAQGAGKSLAACAWTNPAGSWCAAVTPSPGR